MTGTDNQETASGGVLQVWRKLSRRGQAALDLLGVGQSAQRRSQDALDYWSDPSAPSWRSNSHWRDGETFADDSKWLAIGRRHVEMYELFASAVGFEGRPLRRVVEWGAGGGANAVHFAPLCEEFVAVDVVQESLTECGRQVRLAAPRSRFVPILADVDNPELAASKVGNECDLFLCFYVLELVSDPAAGLRILHAAAQVLATGGMAMVQIKYRTQDRRTWSHRRAYRSNIASMTTYGIDEFWLAAAETGLTPRLLTLVPRDDLDERYAYYALTKDGICPVSTR